MKKHLLILSLLFISANLFAQKMTFRVYFTQTKMGHGIEYDDAMEKFRAKYQPPASNNGGTVAFNVMGGKQDGNIMDMNVNPKSFAERDAVNDMPEGMRESWGLNIAPHIESRHSEMLVYQPDYSSSKYEDGKDVEKFNMVEYTIINRSKAGDEIRKRFVKMREKLGLKTAVFSTATGEDKVYHSRRLTNGWKELDENYDNETTYDELYGKGAWAKDMAIMSTYWKVTDRFMLTKNKKLSSK